MKKIIFLDVDGVLNSAKTCAEWHEKTGQGGFGGFFDEKDVATDENVKWGHDLVANLKRIVQETGANIVMSSTWRKYFSVDKFKEMFAVYGWQDAPVIGKTEVLTGIRGYEINKYLNENNISKYVILDDDTDMLACQQNNFVNTDGMYGLTSENADRAIQILNN